MHRKQVLFVQEGMGTPQMFHRAVKAIDADLLSCSLPELSTRVETCDLVTYLANPAKAVNLNDLEQMLVNADNKPVLLIVEESMLKSLRLPAHVPCDFALADASMDELAVRLRHLLWPGEEAASSDFIVVDSMTINLSTYQVQVAGEPVDFTYLEYALLAFLVTHPGHAYSRDALLRRVWGFDYYGGSRTVDVHVRRVRAKLGTELAARLVTVRGVGYMFEL